MRSVLSLLLFAAVAQANGPMDPRSAPASLRSQAIGLERPMTLFARHMKPRICTVRRATQAFLGTRTLEGRLLWEWDRLISEHLRAAKRTFAEDATQRRQHVRGLRAFWNSDTKAALRQIASLDAVRVDHSGIVGTRADGTRISLALPRLGDGRARTLEYRRDPARPDRWLRVDAP